MHIDFVILLHSSQHLNQKWQRNRHWINVNSISIDIESKSTSNRHRFHVDSIIIFDWNYEIPSYQSNYFNLLKYDGLLQEQGRIFYSAVLFRTVWFYLRVQSHDAELAQCGIGGTFDCGHGERITWYAVWPNHVYFCSASSLSTHSINCKTRKWDGIHSPFLF